MNESPVRFLHAAAEAAAPSARIVGLPYEGTASYRKGQEAGPHALRLASESIETYDPELDLDLEDFGPLVDEGDLDLDLTTPEQFVASAREVLADIGHQAPLLGLGGEHTVTVPLFEHALQAHPDLAYVVFDAHADLREEYWNTPFSHACVTRRVMEHIGPERIVMLGIRSGTREEFELMRKYGLLAPDSRDGLIAALDKLGDRPLYLSVDLDGFDPAVMPGTGTVEPGGLQWDDFTRLHRALADRRLVGADVVELAPSLDPSGRSAVIAARVARVLLLMLMKSGYRK